MAPENENQRLTEPMFDCEVADLIKIYGSKYQIKKPESWKDLLDFSHDLPEWFSRFIPTALKSKSFWRWLFVYHEVSQHHLYDFQKKKEEIAIYFR